ncbi:protein phosphatase 2C domain-containing protein [Streptomyces sp. SBT349]|uniref:protein phosphatase 2C domain-containing protein n=1 Tax=Streptomyces sp. SBT349 TaxID=1580539 RepID=UPI001F2CF462|nr:protein phosphatase 2C domain-containing protein [Streptomyces sp. SBT349]
MIVLDGVSTVHDGQDPRGGWYAQTLGRRLAVALSATPGAGLRSMLEDAIASVADLSGLRPGASPAATVSIVRLHDHQVDALTLGDSPVIAIRTSGTVEEVRDDRLAGLVGAHAAHARYRDRLRNGGGFQAAEHRELLRQLRDHQMRHVNREVEGAYWIAEAVPEAARHAVTRSWPVSDLAEVLAMTDGVSAVVDEYRLIESWAEFAELCRDRGPARVVQMIRAAESGDPDGKRWPRYKPADDKSLAVLRFCVEERR